MKKFKFSLDTVLAYKQQVLDAILNEHAAVLAQVQTQEGVLEATWERYRDYNEEYCQRKEMGMSIIDAVGYQNGLRVLEEDIRRETEQLEVLRQQEEKKREQVVEAKKETSSLEKLREKKLELYQKMVQKHEENFIDEFVSASRASANSA